MSLYKMFKSGEEFFNETFEFRGVIGSRTFKDYCSGIYEDLEQFRKQEYISIIKEEIERITKMPIYHTLSIEDEEYELISKRDVISHLQSELKAIEEDIIN